MDRFAASQPPTIIPRLQFRDEFFAIRNPQIHGSQDGPSRFVRRYMVRSGDVVVVGSNPCPIGQHTQEVTFRLIVHTGSLSEGLDQVKVMQTLDPLNQSAGKLTIQILAKPGDHTD